MDLTNAVLITIDTKKKLAIFIMLYILYLSRASDTVCVPFLLIKLKNLESRIVIKIISLQITLITESRVKMDEFISNKYSLLWRSARENPGPYSLSAVVR